MRYNIITSLNYEKSNNPSVSIHVWFFSCSKDDDIPSHLKGIVQFKPYTTSQGLRPVIYSDGQLKFIVQMQLAGASQNLNMDIDYDILEGNTKSPMARQTLRITLM